MTRARAVPTVLAASGLLVGCLLLAGCFGDDPAPESTPVAEPTAVATSASPSPSPSASQSPTPSVQPPERPAAMDDDGVEGAKAAALYFAMLDTYIMKTNDTAVYEQMSHPMCDTCANRLEQAREIAKNGDTFTGGETQASIAHAYLQDEATGIWPLDVKEGVGAVSITDPDGREVAAFDPYSDLSRYEVLRIDDEWTIIGVVTP